MENWLIRHAVKNAWQRPYLDGELNIKACRLSPKTGSTGFIREGISTINLPTTGFWHVFHIGKLHVNYGNLNIPANMWKRVSTCINAFSAFIQLYTEAGITFPAQNAWFFKRMNGAVLLAVPQTERYSWLDTEVLYVRFFPGFDGGANAPLVNPTSVEYLEIPNIPKRQAAVDHYNAIKGNVKGWLVPYVNGKPLTDLRVSDIQLWDDVELHVDGRVRRVCDFRIGDLNTYLSTLDGRRKYLLHLPKSNDPWVYNSNVEIQIIHGREIRYYHKHRHQELRQLTWNDLAIPSDRIALLRSSFDAPIPDIDEMIIRVLIRDDFLDLSPLFNADHVHDLYRLKDDLIVDAMVGANANVKEWQAANLEQSFANRLATAKLPNITRDLCTKAYGYNAVGRYTSDTPQRLILDERGWGCRLPDMLARRSTVYEYDGEGVLLEVHAHADDVLYYAVNPNARLIEAVVGDMGTGVNIVDNAPDFTIPEGENVALWMRKLKDEVPTDEYYEAVEGTDYTRIDNLIQWTVDRTRRHPVVIDDNKHLFFETTVNVADGEIRIPIVAVNQEGVTRTLWVPMETVEVWLNGHPLVHTVDYNVRWPELVVVCKTWVSDTTANKISVRARGVTGKLKIPKVGFVTNGLFSDNSTFDARDDKVIRVVAGGGLLLREDVVFREDNTIGSDIVVDGFPYSIDDPTIPLRNLVSGNLYDLRDTARELDGRIEDYLTTWFPTPPPADVVPIPHWYHLYSPLLNKLLWDIKSGALTLVEDDPTYRISTEQLDKVMLRYNDMLQFDPAYIGYDKRFVYIHPHILYTVMDVTELTFAFCDRVNKRYLNGNVQITQYLKIKG